MSDAALRGSAGGTDQSGTVQSEREADDRVKSAIRGADPLVIPIADEISPDKIYPLFENEVSIFYII